MLFVVVVVLFGFILVYVASSYFEGDKQVGQEAGAEGSDTPQNSQQAPPQICTPGENSCDGKYRYGCNVEGTGWNFIESCSYMCQNGGCVETPKICSPYQKRCSLLSPYYIDQCKADGTGWNEGAEYCSAGCVNGACPTPVTAPQAPPERQGSQQTEAGILYEHYSWKYGGYNWSWNPEFPENISVAWKSLPRPPTNDYSLYVTQTWDQEYFDELVQLFKDAQRENGFSDHETVEMVIAFVQSLPYTSDSVTTGFDEYPRYPIETLIDNGGDCEDTAILTAKMLRSMGYGVVLLSLPKHMAVGVYSTDVPGGQYYTYEGRDYYYLETTGEGYEIGEVPAEYKGSRATPLPLVPKEFVQITDGSFFGSNGYEGVNVTIVNYGTATAYNVRVKAYIEADGLAYNEEYGGYRTIEPGDSYWQTLYIKIPAQKYGRVAVHVFSGGVITDSSYSEWWYTGG
jgi:hypothetical protein